MKGSEDNALKWLGAVWHFSSAEHRELFESSPVKYVPQYGGYCADGVAYGQSTANINPAAWRIIDGKLYLNYDEGAAVELEETPGQIEKANQNWGKWYTREGQVAVAVSQSIGLNFIRKKGCT